MPCYMQEWERKWPPIMTIGHVFHRGPVESGPWFTIVQQESKHDGLLGMGGGGRGGGRGGRGGGISEDLRFEIQRFKGSKLQRFKRSLDLSGFKYTCCRGLFFKNINSCVIFAKYSNCSNLLLHTFFFQIA